MLFIPMYRVHHLLQFRWRVITHRQRPDHGLAIERMTALRIEIFPDKCIGVGQCVVAAPDLFQQNEDDGIVYLVRDDAPADKRAEAIAAARLCPTLAIVVHDD